MTIYYCVSSISTLDTTQKCWGRKGATLFSVFAVVPRRSHVPTVSSAHLLSTFGLHTTITRCYCTNSKKLSPLATPAYRCLSPTIHATKTRNNNDLGLRARVYNRSHRAPLRYRKGGGTDEQQTHKRCWPPDSRLACYRHHCHPPAVFHHHATRPQPWTKGPKGHI